MFDDSLIEDLDKIAEMDKGPHATFIRQTILGTAFYLKETTGCETCIAALKESALGD